MLATLFLLLLAYCCHSTATADSTHRSSPLLILAEGRSGSSFLGQLFDADPNFKYVFDPERHSISTKEIASLLRRCHNGTLTPNAASRLLWRCDKSAWCRSQLLAESDGRDVILARRFANYSCADARVVVLSRDPRAVVTSQIRHVRWHDGQSRHNDDDEEGTEGDDGWDNIANDVCRAHKRRVWEARSRGGAVVSYDDLVRAPLQTMASLYLDLGFGALPKEIVRYIRSSELAPEMKNDSDHRLPRCCARS
jgi:hypothetical protein